MRKERMKKGAIVSSMFFLALECIIKMSWCEQNAKICAIVEQNEIN